MSAEPGSQGRVVAIILAAGASTRLGRPKQLVHWAGEKLLERAVRIASEAGCTPVIVLGDAASEISSACDLQPSQVIINPAWQEGMGSSIRTGMQAAITLNAEAVVIMTCDQPAVTPAHLHLLMDTGAGLQSVASAYAGRKGVPAYIAATLFPLLQALKGDSGARELLQHSPTIDLPYGELDVDTEDALQFARGVLLPGAS
jgi:molybdenum cofactor cytidylyltransferase